MTDQTCLCPDCTYDGDLEGSELCPNCTVYGCTNEEGQHYA